MSINFIDKGGNYPVLEGNNVLFEKPGLGKKIKYWRNNNLKQVNKKLAGVKSKVFVEKDIKVKIDLLEKKWKAGFVSKVVRAIVNFARGLFCRGSLEPKYKAKVNENFAEIVEMNPNEIDYKRKLKFFKLNRYVINNPDSEEKDLVKFFVSQKNENDKKDNKEKSFLIRFKKDINLKNKEVKDGNN